MVSAISTLWTKKEPRLAHTPKWGISQSGFMVGGELVHVSPLNVSDWDINFTSFPGKCSGVLYSLLFWLGKWGYKNVKVDDTIEVSPMDQKYYQITIAQKQALERQVKEGLASIRNSVSDFELLFHDLRKYDEFVEYFKQRETALKNNDDDLLQKAEQSLKAIFIDQVDVHTGEGVALKLIAPRWPTIIADFMRMKDEDTNPNKIAKKYKVSEAEGVVLATKNKLYIDWRTEFENTVKMRYRRMFDLVKARKFSIDEYKRMLRPYIQRYRSINEVGALSGLSKQLSWVRPGAQTASFDTVTLWSFKEMTPAEHGKPSFEAERGTESVLKIPFCSSFKAAIKKNMEYLNENNELGEDLTALPLSPSGIEPLDKWVWALYKYIEDFYSRKSGFDIRFSLAELLKYRNDFVSGWGNHQEPYYKCFDVDVTRIVIRLPDGTELEDMTFNPIYFFLDTQNILFLRFLEIKAQEKELERYINEMLGETTRGKKIEELSKEYEKLFEVYSSKTPSEKKEETINARRLREYRNRAQKQVEREVTQMKKPFKFLKKGAYEPEFDDRITGPWFTDIGGGFAVQVMKLLKTKFGVPGFTMPGVK